MRLEVGLVVHRLTSRSIRPRHEHPETVESQYERPYALVLREHREHGLIVCALEDVPGITSNLSVQKRPINHCSDGRPIKHKLSLRRDRTKRPIAYYYTSLLGSIKRWRVDVYITTTTADCL
jgi:hypothetical protein